MADDQLGLVDLQLKGRVAHPEVEQYQARPGPGAPARGRLADGGHQRVGGGHGQHDRLTHRRLLDCQI